MEFQYKKEISLKHFMKGKRFSVELNHLESTEINQKPNLQYLYFPKVLSRYLYSKNKNFLVSLVPTYYSQNIFIVTMFCKSFENDILQDAMKFIVDDLKMNIQYKIENIEFSFDDISTRNAIENLIERNLEENNWIYVYFERRYLVKFDDINDVSFADFSMNVEINSRKIVENKSFSKLKLNEMKKEKEKSCVNIHSKIVKIGYKRFVENKKYFEIERIFSLPRFSFCYCHRIVQRSEWMRKYWFFIYGINIDMNETRDVVCSFTGCEDDSMFEYPIECMFYTPFYEKYSKLSQSEMQQQINQLNKIFSDTLSIF
ncbi:hypothetical protein TVAG_089110 [Trichomonas vaginalis G3]|uniref:Uncharacterized protein n=1 Tax=Trichomonas vaginalis (strain ATCC PRA-98 / G3) TaxID=412133 RepID=A2G4R1_TRIV3|nr:hypothetical protein TVAGG3_0637020 [Trichomonas vaginalis G3]EAX87855.1 hypothetical protein TVAG_089110 [Trichomonas vaginalis G3]KAI5504917.1 hypothetical protein TVAGG3_0637020 [Trichomonas vaginalis G3]|eukprot:XP_001300785.1 hypothetical protein [Trichomonas vaginalis G3]